MIKLTKVRLFGAAIILVLVILIGFFVFGHRATNENGLFANSAKANTPKTMVAGPQRIWYVARIVNGQLAYNSNIDQVLVSENGKITSYNFPDSVTHPVNLRNLSNKSANQIIKLAQKNDKEYLKEQIKDQNHQNMVNAQDEYNNHNKKLLHFMRRVRNTKYQSMTSNVRKWKLIPDDGGNQIVSESFAFANLSSKDFATKYQYGTGALLDNAKIKIRGTENLVLATSIQQMKILGKNYAGWMLDESSDQNEDALITATNAQAGTRLTKNQLNQPQY
ncbi:MAG: hypothetical protein ABF899_01430 [Oenococcus sp.]|uniref:hypothetical protein n=1 Tax=Oenococcus sp. TaxID=1979414 RepID=UPI0039EA76AD